VDQASRTAPGVRLTLGTGDSTPTPHPSQPDPPAVRRPELVRWWWAGWTGGRVCLRILRRPGLEAHAASRAQW